MVVIVVVVGFGSVVETGAEGKPWMNRTIRREDPLRNRSLLCHLGKYRSFL